MSLTIKVNIKAGNNIMPCKKWLYGHVYARQALHKAILIFFDKNTRKIWVLAETAIH